MRSSSTSPTLRYGIVMFTAITDDDIYNSFKNCVVKIHHIKFFFHSLISKLTLLFELDDFSALLELLAPFSISQRLLKGGLPLAARAPCNSNRRRLKSVNENDDRSRRIFSMIFSLDDLFQFVSQLKMEVLCESLGFLSNCSDTEIHSKSCLSFSFLHTLYTIENSCHVHIYCFSFSLECFSQFNSPSHELFLAHFFLLIYFLSHHTPMLIVNECLSS